MTQVQILPPVDLKAVLLIALLNPVSAVVAFWLGRWASEWQKLPVAAFAGALVGYAAVYLATWMGTGEIAHVARAAGGIFAAQFVIGLAWAFVGQRTRQSSLLSIWLVGTAIALVTVAVWAFAPVLAFAVLLAGGLGLLSLLMIELARGLRRWREGTGGGDRPGE
jgi:hypothetical protein